MVQHYAKYHRNSRIIVYGSRFNLKRAVRVVQKRKHDAFKVK